MPLKRFCIATMKSYQMLSPDPLNQPALQAWLQQERQALISRMRQQVCRSDDPSLMSLASDMAGVADGEVADLMRRSGIALFAYELAELREINLALQRISQGNYGACIECGRTIDSVRLNAWPAARQCMTCKEAFEKRRGIVGWPAI